MIFKNWIVDIFKINFGWIYGEKIKNVGKLILSKFHDEFKSVFKFLMALLDRSVCWKYIYFIVIRVCKDKDRKYPLPIFLRSILT